MLESLTRQPLAKTIASRKSVGKSMLMPVPEGENSPGLKGYSQYTLSPSRSAKSFPNEAEGGVPDDSSEPDQLMMTDNATDLRARMEAELIALRRAQSIFAESHPSVDVHGKLQDLQEMYIGDLLVKDCQISQMKSQLDSLVQDRSARSNISTPTTTASVPPPNTSMLAARVQSLQRSVSSERQRRLEVEARLEDVLRHQEGAIDAKAEINRLVTSHRTESHQLKARLTQMQEANKRLQEKVFKQGLPLPSSGEQSPAAMTTGGASSPASSAVGLSGLGTGASDKVAYVKYASLRAEKRQMEAKLTAQIEELTVEKSRAISEKEAEIDKLKEHNRRVVADLERKARVAQQTKTEEGKELRELRQLFDCVANEKSVLERRNAELLTKIDQLNDDLIRRDAELAELIDSEKFLSVELEERDRRLAEQGNSIDVEKLKEERLDLLERVEEREDVLKSLQDEAAANALKMNQLLEKLDSKEREIAAMISQADELDNLLARADQDVTSSRLKIEALTKELEAVRGAGNRADSMLKAVTVNMDQMKKNFESEKQVLVSRIEAIMEEKGSIEEKKEGRSAALAQAESKISQLESELDRIRHAIKDQPKSGVDMDDTLIDSAMAAPNGNIAKAESLFHKAVELCSESDFEQAVSLLQKAAEVLSNLSKAEILNEDFDSLRVLESDIYGQLGVAFQSLSQVAEAVQSYTTAVDIDPEAHACHANLAVLLHHQSRGKEAEGHAALAAQLAPDIEEYQQLLAQIKSSSSGSSTNITLSSPSSPPRLRHSTRW